MAWDQNLIFAKMGEEVEKVVHAGRQRTPSSRLIIGVSGGPDSVALLHILATELEPRANIVVAHLDHQIRLSAPAEAKWVAELCEAWGVACIVGQKDAAALARQNDLSIEEAARQARYEFLAEVATEQQSNLVLVGHHADDQAETVLMHFLRGSGLAGLRGMLPVSELPGSPEKILIRPMLRISREAILAYCAANELKSLSDESNLDTTFFRNRLRHELLPYLADYNPQIRQVLQHSAAVLAADNELLESIRKEAWRTILRGSGNGWLSCDLAGWRALPLSLRRSTLRHAVGQLRSSLRDVGFVTVENARRVLERGLVGAEATLPGEIALTVGYAEWRMVAPGGIMPLPDLPQLQQEGILLVPGQFKLAGDWSLWAELPGAIPEETITGNPSRWVAYLSGDDLEVLEVRARREGERYQPQGMQGKHARVKDVMINAKIPAQLRALWPIVALDERLAWLVGERIASQFCYEPGERLIKLTCKRDPASAGNWEDGSGV